jgi:hypothetical protein
VQDLRPSCFDLVEFHLIFAPGELLLVALGPALFFVSSLQFVGFTGCSLSFGSTHQCRSAGAVLPLL